MNPPFLLVFFIRVRKQGRGLLCSRSIKGRPPLTHTLSPSGQPAKALTAFAKFEKPFRVASKASRKQTQYHRSAATMIPHESFKQFSNTLKTSLVDVNPANNTHTACRQHVVDAIKTNILPKPPVRHRQRSGKLIAAKLLHSATTFGGVDSRYQPAHLGR